MTEQRILRLSRTGSTADGSPNFHTQVTHAAERFVEALRAWPQVPEGAEVMVQTSVPLLPELGDEGYAIQTESETRIVVTANTDAGAANGIYGLMLAVRTKQIERPFAESWNVVTTPRWADRRMAPASYAMAMTEMTPETWTLDDWKRYIDFVRSFNINRITILGLFPYHPDLPSTFKAKWRMEAQRDAIAYAHEHGMKVNVMTTYNLVPTQVFWDHPELRTDAVRGYFGLALCWSKAKDVIMKYHRYSLEFLEGLDGVEIMVTEPLGWCLCDQCRPDTAAVWLDAVREIGDVLKGLNPAGEVAFWNWLSGFFSALRGVYPPTTQIENVHEIQNQLLDGMPPGTVFFDLSVNQMNKDEEFGPRLTHPDSIEILKAAPERGFESRIFHFYSDKEFGMLDRLNLFPKPFLDYTLDEFAYSQTLPVNGVCSYRLAPPGRFLSDFFFMRLAWDPNIGRVELVDEAAAYLTSNAEDRASISGAIELVEKYWHKRDRDDLTAARDLFVRAGEANACEDLERIRNGLVMLAMIDEYARIAKEVEDALESKSGDAGERIKAREAKLLEVYQAFKQYPIYQGVTTDGIWEPRSILMLLRPRMEMWANCINHRGYYH